MYVYLLYFFRNELFEARQINVTKLFNLLKLSTEDSSKYVSLINTFFVSVEVFIFLITCSYRKEFMNTCAGTCICTVYTASVISYGLQGCRIGINVHSYQYLLLCIVYTGKIILKAILNCKLMYLFTRFKHSLCVDVFLPFDIKRRKRLHAGKIIYLFIYLFHISFFIPFRCDDEFFVQFLSVHKGKRLLSRALPLFNTVRLGVLFMADFKRYSLALFHSL